MIDVRWKGTYSPGEVYFLGDVVYLEDNGFTYVCTVDSTELSPSSPGSGFELFAGFNIDGGLF